MKYLYVVMDCNSYVAIGWSLNMNVIENIEWMILLKGSWYIDISTL